MTGFSDATDKVTFTVDSTSTQLYDFTIRAAAIYGDKRTSVILNGGASSEVYFPAADTWADIAAGQLLLNQGSNTIEIVNNWGWSVMTLPWPTDIANNLIQVPHRLHHSHTLVPPPGSPDQ